MRLRRLPPIGETIRGPGKPGPLAFWDVDSGLHSRSGIFQAQVTDPPAIVTSRLSMQLNSAGNLGRNECPPCPYRPLDLSSVSWLNGAGKGHGSAGPLSTYDAAHAREPVGSELSYERALSPSIDRSVLTPLDIRIADPLKNAAACPSGLGRRRLAVTPPARDVVRSSHAISTREPVGSRITVCVRAAGADSWIQCSGHLAVVSVVLSGTTGQRQLAVLSRPCPYDQSAAARFAVVSQSVHSRHRRGSKPTRVPSRPVHRGRSTVSVNQSVHHRNHQRSKRRADLNQSVHSSIVFARGDQP